MKMIFECETEVGKCNYEAGDVHGFHYAEPDYAIVMAHTLASVTAKGLLKVEQHCYLRHGEEVPDQSWIRPQMALEPVLGSAEEMRELAATMHEQFVERARKAIPEQVVA